MFNKEVDTLRVRVGKGPDKKTMFLVVDSKDTAKAVAHQGSYLTVHYTTKEGAIEDMEKRYSMQKFMFAAWRFFFKQFGKVLVETTERVADEDFLRRDISVSCGACKTKYLIMNNAEVVCKEALSWGYTEYKTAKDYYMKVIDKVVPYMAGHMFPKETDPLPYLIEAMSREKLIPNADIKPVEEWNKEMGFEFTRDQTNAYVKIKEFLANDHQTVFVVDGAAGTGKTYLLEYVVKTLLVGEYYAVLCPSNVTASNINSHLQMRIATTIHKHMYRPLVTKMHVDLEKDEYVSELTFEKNKRVSFPRIAVVDEYSMIGKQTYRDIVNRHKKTIFFGDSFQLPPVNDEKVSPSINVSLTEIVRSKDHIIRLASYVRIHKRLPHRKYLERITCSKKEAMEVFFREDSQALCYTNKKRRSLNRAYKQQWCGYEDKLCYKDRLIALEQGVLEKGRFYRVREVKKDDDIVICSVFDADGNHYTAKTYKVYLNCVKYPDLRAYVEEYVPQGRRYTVLNTYTAFDYAYCVTVHKFQGSEAENVVLFLDGGTPRADYASWLYTAITRAKKRLYLTF